MAVYEKTEAGMQEIAAEQRALNVRQRQILILIDGKRDSEDLQAGLKSTNVNEILVELEKLGFIVMLEKATERIASFSEPQAEPVPVITTPTTYTQDSELALDEVQISTIKQILLSSTDEYLGIMGRSIKLSIATATSYLQIKTCVSQWHMAMRESKLGRGVAGTLMEQIQATMQTHH